MTTVTEALVQVRKARDKVEAVRDVLPLIADQLEENSTQRLFEAPFLESIMAMSLPARESVFFAAYDAGGPLMSIFNEYAQYMELMAMIVGKPIVDWGRPVTPAAAEVLDANNPVGAVYAVLRKNSSLSPAASAGVLEAAFPQAVNGLSEEARNFLYSLAAERGVTAIEVANAYVPLVEMVADVRFLTAED